MTDVSGHGRRAPAFPPLWSVPLLVIGAIIVVVLACWLSLGVLGVPVAFFAVYWLERKADAYVRSREARDV